MNWEGKTRNALQTVKYHCLGCALSFSCSLILLHTPRRGFGGGCPCSHLSCCCCLRWLCWLLWIYLLWITVYVHVPSFVCYVGSGRIISNSWRRRRLPFDSCIDNSNGGIQWTSDLCAHFEFASCVCPYCGRQQKTLNFIEEHHLNLRVASASSNIQIIEKKIMSREAHASVAALQTNEPEPGIGCLVCRICIHQLWWLEYR